MRQDPDSTDFWLHVSPAESDNFPNALWKSKCEPIYDPNEKDYVHAKDSYLEGDRFVHLNPNARSLLSLKIRENLRPGIRIHVVNGRCAEIKDISNDITEPIKHLYDIEEGEDFEAVRDEEGMLFALKGTAVIHERKAFLITRAKGKKDILRVDYVNESGKIIRHHLDKDVDESYIEFGRKKDYFIPRIFGDLWASDQSTQYVLSALLVQGYMRGVKYHRAPIKEDMIIRVKVLPDNLVSINTNGDFYGLGNNLLFCRQKSYRSNKRLNTRSLDGVIVNGILSYRWFFDRPKLNAKVVLVHDTNLESPDRWETDAEYKAYMDDVKAYAENGVRKLEELINSSVAKKWAKRDKRNMYFDPAKINFYQHCMDEDYEDYD